MRIHGAKKGLRAGQQTQDGLAGGKKDGEQSCLSRRPSPAYSIQFFGHSRCTPLQGLDSPASRDQINDRDDQSDYQVKPPLHTRFKGGGFGNPGGHGAKTLPTLLAAALTTNGRHRKFTKREAIIAQMVDKSPAPGIRFRRSGTAHPRPSTSRTLRSVPRG